MNALASASFQWFAVRYGPNSATRLNGRERSVSNEAPSRQAVGAALSMGALLFVIFSLLVLTLRDSAKNLEAACEAQASVASWPEAPGRIVDGYVLLEGPGRNAGYRGVVRYIIETPQGPVGGSVIRFDESPYHSSEGAAWSAIRGYPAGMQVKVKHHPDNPYNSLLDGSAPRWDDLRNTKIGMWIAFGFWVLNIVYFTPTLVRWMRYRQQANAQPSPSHHIQKPK